MKAKQRKARQARIAKAKERCQTEESGRLSDYILPWSSVERGDLLLSLARVSRRHQRSHLAEQHTANEIAAMKKGAAILKVKGSHVGNGGDPSWIAQYAKIAKQFGAIHRVDVKLLAGDPSRFIRSADYHPVLNPHAVPSLTQCELLKQAAMGLGLVTLLDDPDATPEEIRSHQTKRGMQAKGSKPGRPKKLSRTELLAEAQRLHEQGTLQVVIAGQLRVDPATISRWLRKGEK